MSIRVMHLVRPADGGMREHVKELVWGMPHGKIHTMVACPPESALFRELPSWVQKTSLQLQDGVKPWLDMRTIMVLRKLLDQHPIDILHMHGAKSALIGRTAARLANRKPRLICTFHNFIEPDSRIMRAALLRTERKLASRTDRYIAVSNALADQLRQQVSFLSDKVVTVYNGLPPAKKRFSRRYARTLMNVPQDAVVIGTIARLVPEKGVEDLVLAFRMLRNRGHDPYLVIIGDGPQKEELQILSADLNDNIRWMGAVNRASQLISGFDLYIQSSRKEGFGLAVLEAMREGVPVIATDVGGLPEVVGNLDSGVLIPASSPLKLCQHMDELLTDGERRRVLGAAGKHRVQEHFSLEQMIQSTIRIYNEVLDNRRGFE